MLEFISGERGRCGVLWTSGTMNSGHVTERVCVHVCWSGSSKCDFVLLELLALVASRNTTGKFLVELVYDVIPFLSCTIQKRTTGRCL